MPLYKNPNSPFWYVRIGRKTRRSTGTRDRAKAEEFEQVLTERLWRADKLGDRSAISWDEASKRWLKSSARKRTRDRELLAWMQTELHLEEEMVSTVADAQVLERIRERAAVCGWAQSTTDRLMNTVRAVLRYHARREKLPPPWVPMFNAQADEPRFLSREEFAQLLKQLPAHLALAAQLAVLTLLRKSAQAQLLWSRVDLKERRAWIPRRQQKAGQTFGFPLSREAVRVLTELRARSPHGDRVFQFEGRPIADFNTAAFRKAAKRAGIEGLRWHDLRHTGASWAVRSGVTLPELMALGDWKSYRSVLMYAHFAPSHAAEAAERVAKWKQSGLRKARHA